MKIRNCAIALIATGVLLFAAAAWAAPTEVNVRIEGANETLFEGPIVTDGHSISSTDGQPHHCDGTNAGSHSEAGPTATAALDDAARIAKFHWAGSWNADFDDFLVNGVGPDSQDTAGGHYWGFLVNGKYSSVGGCQMLLNSNDNVLWAYDPWSLKQHLSLEGPTVVNIGEPVVVKVTDSLHKNAAVAGATVEKEKTGPDGVAVLHFGTSGIQTVKAHAPNALRSNALHVCVRSKESGSCTQ